MRFFMKNIVKIKKTVRSRDVHIIEPQYVLHVINYTLTIIVQQNCKLIDKPNLKKNLNYWKNSTYRLGLTHLIAYVRHSLKIPKTRL